MIDDNFDECHYNKVTGIKINIETQYVCSCSTDGSVVCISLSTFKIFRRMIFDINKCIYNCIDCNGNLIAVGGSDPCVIHLYDINTKTMIEELKGHTDIITNIKFYKSKLVTISNDSH